MDADRFRNHEGMIKELVDYGYELFYVKFMSEADRIHLYDITFLVGRYDFVEESRRYRPSGTRLPMGGPYGGQFPYIVHEPKRTAK